MSKQFSPSDISTDISSFTTCVLVFDDSMIDGMRRYSIIPVCDKHAVKRRMDPDKAPKAIEDSMRLCADCVIDAGYKYHVHIEYFRSTGKYYSAGDYLTKCTHMFEIFEEFGKIRRSGAALPGLIGPCNYFHAYLTAFAHPHNHPFLFIATEKDE